MLRGYKPPRPRCGNRVSNCKRVLCLLMLSCLPLQSQLTLARLHLCILGATLITVYCFGVSLRTPVIPQTLSARFIPVVSDGVFSFAGWHESRVLLCVDRQSWALLPVEMCMHKWTERFRTVTKSFWKQCRLLKVSFLSLLSRLKMKYAIAMPLAAPNRMTKNACFSKFQANITIFD